MNLKVASILLTILAAQSALAANWLTDISAAQSQAKQENKVILVNFTGSDWCGSCIKLKGEVFSKPEFDTFAGQNLVLLEIDFPRKKAMSPAAKKANSAFADKYKVSGYPTVHVLDGDGKSLGQLGYMPGGPNAFIAKVKSVAGNRIKAPAAVAENKPGKPVKQPADAPPAFNGAPTFPPKVFSQLELRGISGPANARLALINNQTLAAGETGKVKLGDTVMKVTCHEVHDDYVVVSLDGAKERRELRMRDSL